MELSVMEQPHQAVLAVVQDGWKIVEVADRLGVSRQTIHNWIARYEQGGLAALAEGSHLALRRRPVPQGPLDVFDEHREPLRVRDARLTLRLLGQFRAPGLERGQLRRELLDAPGKTSSRSLPSSKAWKWRSNDPCARQRQ